MKLDSEVLALEIGRLTIRALVAEEEAARLRAALSSKASEQPTFTVEEGRDVPTSRTA